MLQTGVSVLHRQLITTRNMPSDQLATVAYSLIVTRILYALPAWGGFLSVELCHRIDAFFRRIKRYGFTHLTITVSDLVTPPTAKS